MIMGYLRKSDLKAARLVCRLWSSLVIRWLFDRIYISPRKLDLMVFKSITSDERLSWAVKELVYDATYYDLSMDRSTYVDRLVDQVESLTWSLEEDEFEASDKELNRFLIYASESHKLPDEERLEQNAQFRGLDVVHQGYQRYMENAKDQSASFHSGLFLVRLCNGLKSMANLDTVVISDDWQTEADEGEELDIAEVELNTSTLNPVRRTGSFMARSLNPLFLEPTKWRLNEIWDDGIPDGSKEYETMIRALSASKRRVHDLQICPGTGSGIPGSFFAAENHLQSSDSFSIHSTNAFCHLRVLNLRIVVSGYPSLSAEPLSALKYLLPTISGLTDLDLSFGRDGEGGGNIYRLDDVFEPSFVAKKLQVLALAGFAATQDQLMKLLNNHRSIIQLRIGDSLLLTGDWGCMLDEIRESLLDLRTITFTQPIQKLAGDYMIGIIWDYTTLDPVISRYVKKGGKNPFRFESQDGEEQVSGSVNPS